MKNVRLCLAVSVLSVTILNFAFSSANAQEKRNYVKPGSDIYFVLQHGNSLTWYVTSNSQYITPLGLLLMLDNPAVLRELEIVKHQESDIKNSIKDIEAAIEKYVDIRYSVGVTDKEEKQIFESCVNESEEMIRSALLPHQLDVFRSILLQYEIARNGALASLVYGTLNEKLDVSKQQLAPLFQKYFEQYRQAEPEINKLRQDSTQATLEALSPKQRRKLVEISVDERTLDSLQFVWLARADKAYVEQLKDFVARSTSSVPSWNGLVYPVSFEVQCDGSIRFERPRKRNDLDATIDLALIKLLMSSFGREQLDLSGDQRKAIQKMSNDWRKFKIQKDAAYEYWPENFDSLQEFTDEWIARACEFSRGHLENLEMILTVDQLTKLEFLALRSEILATGLEFSLCHGQVGKELKLTSSQKQKIQERYLKRVPKVKKQLSSLEKKVTEAVVQSLTAEQQKILDGLLGDMLPLNNGNIEFHAWLMANKDQSQEILRELMRSSKRDLRASLIVEASQPK